MRDKIMYWAGVWGESLGWLILIGVFAYDPLMQGFRGFYEWNLGQWGCLAGIAGMIVIAISRWCRDNL